MIKTCAEKIVYNFKRHSNGKLVATKKYVLHSSSCNNSKESIAIMELKLSEDNQCLERKNHASSVHSETPVSALLNAVERDHDKCVQFLVTAGADITDTYYENIYVNQDIDIINVCIRMNSKKTLSYFFKENVYSSVRNTYPNYYLLYAIRDCYGLPKDIDIFLKNGIPIDDFQDFNIQLNSYPFYSPTVEAIFKCEIGVLKHLLFHGGAVDYRQTGRDDLSNEVRDCISLIHHFAVLAFTSDMLKVLYVLYEFGANLWERNRFGLTPLQIRETSESIERELSARGGHYDQHYYHSQRFVVGVNDVESNKIDEKMIMLMGKPLTLKSLCRITLVRLLGVKYLDTVNKLENMHMIPRELKPFMQGNDLPDNDDDDLLKMYF